MFETIMNMLGLSNKDKPKHGKAYTLWLQHQKGNSPDIEADSTTNPPIVEVAPEKNDRSDPETAVSSAGDDADRAKQTDLPPISAEQEISEIKARIRAEYEESLKKWESSIVSEISGHVDSMREAMSKIVAAGNDVMASNSSKNRQNLLALMRPYRGKGFWSPPQLITPKPNDPTEKFCMEQTHFMASFKSEYFDTWHKLYDIVDGAEIQIKDAYGPLFKDWTIKSEVSDAGIVEVVATQRTATGVIQKHIRTTRPEVGSETSAITVIFIPSDLSKSYPLGSRR